MGRERQARQQRSPRESTSIRPGHEQA